MADILGSGEQSLACRVINSRTFDTSHNLPCKCSVDWGLLSDNALTHQLAQYFTYILLFLTVGSRTNIQSLENRPLHDGEGAHFCCTVANLSISRNANRILLQSKHVRQTAFEVGATMLASQWFANSAQITVIILYHWRTGDHSCNS